MATVYVQPSVQAAQFLASTFPQIRRTAGTNFPVFGLSYDASADEAAFLNFRAVSYGSGNLTVDLEWYADTASSGDVVWGCALSAITSNTDTQDIETDALATENTATDSHLGTTGQRLHRATVTVSNLDSLAADDWVTLRVRRLGSNGSDTMAGDAILVGVTISYSDT